MQDIKTSHKDFLIRVDSFPYNKSIKLLDEINHWWTHPSRDNLKYKDKISNYSLDDNIVNSLGFSFKTRLADGAFTFLYYKEELVAYLGMRYKDGDCFAHRLAVHPTNYQSVSGSAPAFLVPYQILQAKNRGCRYYKMSFNEHNKKLYDWWRLKIYKKIDKSSDFFIKGNEMISKFEFVGKEFIYGSDQYVCRLNLDRDDIEDFCKF